MERHDARYGFFKPFRETRRGQILGLATLQGAMRDGLAVATLARHFPPDHEGILVEPCRPGLQLAESIVLVGWSRLFVSAGEHPIWGDALVLADGERKLGERLRKLEEQCCYRIHENGQRRLLNDVTGTTYESVGSCEEGFLVDFAVIRRLFRGPSENTVTVEGVHGLGTLGAAKIVTSAAHLERIWEAVQELPEFDESKPLEILVRTEYHGGREPRVYSLDTVKAVPLAVVYNRQWVRGLEEETRWTDQMPWSLETVMRGEEPAVAAAKVGAMGLPRVEIEADLRAAALEVRNLCREILLRALPVNGDEPVPVSREQLERLGEALAAEIDRFRVLFVEGAPYSPMTERHRELPAGRTSIRRERKRFFVHLGLRRMLRHGLKIDEAAIRRFFPDFAAGQARKTFASQFIGSVPGKMREGFEALLGEAAKPKDHLRIEYSRREGGYALRLGRASLVVRLRF